MTIYYCRPGATFNGDGSLPTAAASGGGAGARNTWVGFTITASNTHRTLRGTTHSGGIRPQSLDSSAGAPLIFEAYYNDDGTDDPSKPLPVFDHAGGSNGVGAIFVDTCKNVIVRNLAGKNSNGSLAPGSRSGDRTTSRCRAARATTASTASSSSRTRHRPRAPARTSRSTATRRTTT